MAADVGRRVASCRGKMSAQQLADRCSALGMPSLSRIVITRLENGRRDAVSTAEVSVLAAALGVSPVELIFPVGSQPDAEILPGVRVRMLDAVHWYAGEMALDVTGAALTLRTPGSAEQSGVSLLESHARLVRTWHEAAGEVVGAISRQAAGIPESAERRMAGEQYKAIIAESLRLVRGEMQRRGMILPELPPALADLDGQVLADG